MPFWLHDYERMIDSVRRLGLRPRGVKDFLAAPDPRSAIIRHDVDRRLPMAVQMAMREAAMGFHSTYYFRCTGAGVFPEEACRRVAALGHEVGYHYEDLSRMRGDRVAAMTAFRSHLAALRRIVPCATVSMHGSPLSVHDNRTLLDEAALRECALVGDATNTLRQFNPVYFTDTGGTWNDSSVNFRDFVGQMKERCDPLRHAELEAVVRAHPADCLTFNLHPERWAADSRQYVVADASDRAARLAKRVIKMLG
jgi:hypothetical protein